jgi:hypothetical protein
MVKHTLLKDMREASTPLMSFGEGIWLGTTPVSFLGLRLSVTMTVLRLDSNDLLVSSPIGLTPELRDAVLGLGSVAHLYAPNLFHHQWLAEWANAFPSARVHAPAGLEKKQPSLRVDRVHGSLPEPAFAGVVDELPINGFRLRETALLYRPAQTLVVADLVHNIGRPTHAWTATYTRGMGFYDRVALSRMLRWTAFDAPKAARQSIDSMLGHSFDRVVVGHGEPLTTGGHDAIATAYDWLHP